MVVSKPLEDVVMTAAGLGQGAPQPRVEPSQRRVRAYAGGVAIADSRHVMTLTLGLPVYYFPLRDVRMDLLEASDQAKTHPVLGERSFFNLRTDDRLVENVGWRLVAPPPAVEALADHVAFYWDRLDHWYEEDDEVFVHPRDTRHRVDVLHSSRQVRVIVDDEVVADSDRPRLLFETSLPTRFYLPRMDVRMDLLTPSQTVTQCPYKGRTVHFDLNLAGRQRRDIAWSYPFPIPECPKIENLIAFYDERVDAIEVDGEIQPKPRTPWST